MIKHKQFESITTETLSVPDETLKVHTHDYHEFVLIRHGAGKHLVKEDVVDFKAGDLFFISPGESHAFHIRDHAEASVIRFNEQMRSLLRSYVSQWGLQAMVIAKAKSPLNTKVPMEKNDAAICAMIFDMVAVLSKQSVRNESLILHQLISLITLIDRNTQQTGKGPAGQESTNPIVDRMIKHIHKHLHRPEMLTIGHLSETFNIPASYLGVFFKRNTGRSVKRYIDYSRLIMIGRKIRNGDGSFSEIAYKFGFTDESHFLKRFKQYYGMSPSAYRKLYNEKLGV